MVAMLVAFSAPAMANDKNDNNVQRNSSNIFDNKHHKGFFDDNCCRGHDGDFRFHDGFHDGDVEIEIDDGDFGFHDDGDEIGNVFDDNAFFLFPFFAVEEIDIDCDGVDDDWDGGIDEGADCEVEIEFFEWWD
jgi:hypothetical protein